MVFSKESSRAVFEMGNVELIELKKSSIQCPSCLQRVFEGTLLCKCGKLIKPEQDVMSRIKEAFEIQKNTILPHISDFHKRFEPVAAASPEDSRRIAECKKRDRAFTSIWDRWQKDEIYRKSQLVHNWSDARVRFLDHIVHFSIHHNAVQPQRER